ncbi:hypothetical protein EXIGLDRAFT_751178 [Exidia glandulosa HHB12029]|uniref:F-box domain-containing protein n=1 Tax=Exidia glandulosa HHB12029 TaxID=1314781 RepID=A0A165FRU4_EXIGL|nr:hypothetical protein EXIGLDRAFT_751178 [Exidia glandulosa HHB12029]
MALPYELYDQIFARLGSDKDLCTVALACSTFSSIAGRYVYHTIRPDLDHGQLLDLLATLASKPDKARSVRTFSLTWKLDTMVKRFVVQDCEPSDEMLHTIATAGLSALSSMSNLRLLVLDHDIDRQPGLLDNCTLPSLSALQTRFSIPVRDFLKRHPHVTSLELGDPLDNDTSAASTIPPGDPLVYFGGSCATVADLLAPNSARELADGATLHVKGHFVQHARAFIALDAWHERTGRRLGCLLVNYATLGWQDDPAGEVTRGCRHVKRLALVGDKLHLHRLGRVEAFLKLCPGVQTLYISPLHADAAFDVGEPWLPFETILMRAKRAIPGLRTIVGRTGRSWHANESDEWVDGAKVLDPLPSPFFLKEKQRKSWL